MKRFACHINKFLYYYMRVGKRRLKCQFKLASALFLIMLLVACLAACQELPSEESNNKIEYTDVEYSEDGREVKLYLDGVGVPKTQAQRAMTKDLAAMAYNYVEVIFISGGTIARAAWELGAPAEITGMTRNIDYGSVSGSNAAAMFVGNKDSKVLLGVGKLTGTSTGTTTITDDTRSVTFTLSALQSGLLVGAPPGTARPNVALQSFSFTGQSSSNSFLRTLGTAEYPVYRIANGISTAAVSATYAFSFMGTPADYTPAIRHIRTTAVYPIIQKRTPRYPDGAGYKEPRSSIDTGTTVEIGAAYVTSAAQGGSFSSSVPITFTPAAKNGIFAFHLQIPVYMVSTNAATNGGPGYETWFIRTGVGSEFYSLDDGISRGGCVLISVGIDNFSDIEWTWFKQ